MTIEPDPLEADLQFDRAMVAADTKTLERLLANDFVLVDLMGNQVQKSALLAAIDSRELRFEILDASDVAARIYGDTAVLTGVTEMRARQGDATFAGRSRFTHVYVKLQGEWCMVAAQGTIIPDQPA